MTDDLVKRLSSGNANHIDADIWMKDAAARIEAAEARVKELEGALTLIERLYYLEAKDASWRAAHMNGVARDAQDGNDLGHYRRIFPRAALKGERND